MKELKDLAVLVVDDDSAIFAVIARMFSHFKAKVDYAANATDALDCLKTRDYKTMIANIDMPVLGGLELARSAHELNPVLNIVLFSGNTTEQVVNLVLNPMVSDISGTHRIPYSLGDMLMGVLTKETGKTFLLE
jgi:CheY-like chemotaxis protein